MAFDVKLFILKGFQFKIVISGDKFYCTSKTMEK